MLVQIKPSMYEMFSLYTRGGMELGIGHKDYKKHYINITDTIIGLQLGEAAVGDAIYVKVLTKYGIRYVLKYNVTII